MPSAPFLFAALWLVVTTVLALISGWFHLMKAYPNQDEDPIFRVRGQSGSMGLGARLNGILSLSACPSGLRVAMLRVFGPFCRDFLVPWGEITVVRTQGLFGPAAKLRFGNPTVGTLTIQGQVANRLARAARASWPEPGPFPEETPAALRRRVLREWAVYTTLAATFFIVAPRLVAPSQSRPPITVAILFPAVVYGVFALGRLLMRP
jgi:hypothetical protein